MTGAPPREPRWLPRGAVIAIHEEQIREHGGMPGLRDDAALDAALGRPRQQWAYTEPGIHELAASFAFGIARNHPFNDGNKRMALLACSTSLALNGHDLLADKDETVSTFIRLAAGEFDEDSLSDWIAARLHARPAPPQGPPADD